MAEYAFVTVWRIEAPIERVYEAIFDSLAWPSWWDAVTAAQQRALGDAAGIGAVSRFTFRGRLPYVLRFDMRVDRVERPTVLSGVASGELEGRGLWTLKPDGQATLVRYDWQIRTTKPWMNVLAPLPFVRDVFELNHDYVMRRGLVGLRRLLGVSGQELPEDSIQPPGLAGEAGLDA